MKKIIKVYLHSSKERMAEIGEENGLSEDAISEFMYALYEVECTLEVDTDTGDYTILKIEEV